MTVDDRSKHNLRAIRDLLLAAYTEAELRALIARDDQFRPLRFNLSDCDPISTLVLKTIKYCDSRRWLDHLLSLVKADHPEEYARFEDRLRMDREGEA